MAEGIADIRTASAEQSWAHIWNKPLYANMRVPTAAKWQHALSPFMENAWERWGHSGEVVFEKVGRGNSKSDFAASTTAAKEIYAATKIPLSRLLSIQGAAIALNVRAKLNDAPYSDLLNQDLSISVPKIRYEMGRGWGDITVLHFLTDMGVACKPDIHLVRASRNIWGDIHFMDGDKITQSGLYEINKIVADLVLRIDGSITPSRLRYVDKILMEISRFGLV